MQEIIRDILAGNTNRFREIVSKYSDDLLRVAYHFARNWDDAREWTQITFVKCFENLRRYDPQRPFAPWLYRIHVNVCKSHARRAKRYESLTEGAINLHSAPHSETQVDESERIHAQIARLPLKQRTAFILIEIEGMSSAEAAFAMGCKDSTARVHLARAKDTLRKQLTDMGIGNDTLL
ncbi:MAG: RNA polymerase sigma factor [Calditrichaeota bacterium]|nr:RNA polymerase sigma factor [Calditrichota bacterium]MCB9367184.1 RNA polymerase sigma factor [Calditrichota bacterium]